MTYADAFVAIAVCFLIAFASVPLMRKVAPPKAPSAERIDGSGVLKRFREASQPGS